MYDHREPLKKTIDIEEVKYNKIKRSVKLRKKRRKQHLFKRRKETPNKVDLELLKNFNFKEQAEKLNSGKVKLVGESIIVFRTLLSVKENCSYSEILKLDIFDTLIKWSKQSKNEHIQTDALWCLINIVNYSSEHCKKLVEIEYGKFLLDCLKNTSNEIIIECVLYIIGNMAGDKIKYRDYFLNLDAMDFLEYIISNYSNNKVILDHSFNVMAQLLRGKPTPNLKHVTKCFPILGTYMHLENTKILESIFWCISCISDWGDDYIELTIKYKMINKMVEYLNHELPMILCPIIRYIMNVSSGKSENIKYLMKLGCYKKLMNLLFIKRETILLETCWTFSNLATEGIYMIDMLFKSGVNKKLYNIMIEASHDIKLQCIWYFRNIIESECTNDQIESLIKDIDIFKSFNEHLRSSDSEIIVIIIDAITYFIKRFGDKVIQILESKGIIDILEELTNHKDKYISRKAGYIIGTAKIDKEEDFNLGFNKVSFYGPNFGYNNNQVSFDGPNFGNNNNQVSFDGPNFGNNYNQVSFDGPNFGNTNKDFNQESFDDPTFGNNNKDDDYDMN